MRLVAQQVLSLFLVLLAPLAGLGAQDARPTEYQLKAAFLFNFAKFIDWPSTSFSDASSPFVIGVLGENPFGDDLQKLISQKQVGTHPLVVQSIASVSDARKCHILFISNSETSKLRQILEGLRGASVLTVGESEGFISDGGMISFVIEAQKIRFRINAETAKSAGLKISSKLLNLAEHPSH
jgi:hypothetical protein